MYFIIAFFLGGPDVQLDKIIIDTRSRNGWSAIDLGFRFALRRYFSCTLLWLIVASPFLLIAYIQPFPLWVSYLFLWWVKPIIERPILYLFSRELFSQQVSIMDVLKNAKQWLVPGWFIGLSLHRLSVSRSMYMSLTVLEGLRGNEYSKRTSVLGASDMSSKATWLTIMLCQIEQMFYFGCLAIVGLIFSNYVDFVEILIQDDTIITIVIMVVVFAMVSPFYVAAGFMLYISRRIELEGWDIELKFRNWMTSSDQTSVDNNER